MLALSTVAGIASSVVGAVGAKQQSDAQASAAEYEAKVLDQQATSEKERAAAEAQDYRRNESAKIATSRAASAGSGLAFEGTPLLVDEAAVRETALGSMRIGNAGAINATRLENQANTKRNAASNYRSAGKINAGSTLLSGFGSFF